MPPTAIFEGKTTAVRVMVRVKVRVGVRVRVRVRVKNMPSVLNRVNPNPNSQILYCTIIV